MTMTETELAPVPTTENPSGIVHYFCDCRPDVGVCGAPLAGIDAPREAVSCVVCLDLPRLFRCPACGALFK